MKGPLLNGIPDEWGPKFESEAGAVTRTRTGPNEIRFTAPTHMALVLFTPQPDRLISLSSDQRRLGLAPAGAIEVVPAGSELFARWSVAKENLLLAVSPSRLQRLARLEFDTDDFELQPPNLGHVDDKAHVIARLIREELHRSDNRNEDCLDSLITVFGTYLLRHYSSIRQDRSHVPTGGLSPHALRRVNDFIQAHLNEKISLAQMAEVAGFSPCHFLRAFRNSTGMPPHQFLVAARLTRARQLIATTDAPLQLIARTAGFHSNSHLTATMQRHWAIRPGDLRRKR